MIAARNSGHLITASFVVVGLALAWMIYQKLAGSSASDYAPALTGNSAPSVPTLPPEPRFTMPGLEEFDAILARPLFTRSRRPIRGSVAATSVAASQTLGLMLLGVSISSTEKFALVVPDAGGSAFRLREGEDYQGWDLSQIQSNNVLFRQGAREERLELSFDTAPPPPPTTKRSRRKDVQSRLDKARVQPVQGKPEDEPDVDDESDASGTKDD